MLQLAFGFEPFVTGLMMIPTVLGSLASKPIIRQLIQRFGYRQVLITNTLLVGACIASFALTTADTPIWLRALHFFIFGLLNSLQFVSMNTPDPKRFAAAGCQQRQQLPVDDHDAVHEYWRGLGRNAGQPV